MTTESSSLVEKSRDLLITEDLEPKRTPNAWPETAFHAIPTPTTGTPQEEPTFLNQAPTPPPLQQQQQQQQQPQVLSSKTTQDKLLHRTQHHLRCNSSSNSNHKFVRTLLLGPLKRNLHF